MMQLLLMDPQRGDDVHDEELGMEGCSLVGRS